MLRAGIIGLGVGEAHIAGYESHPQCSVVALCDFADDKLEMARSKYPAMRVTAEANDILDDPNIDLVSIASFDNYHHEQIIRALEHNKHVFVEKPLCIYEEEARHIRDALRDRPHLQMSSNLILRKSPRFVELRDMLRNGELGQLYNFEGDYNYGRLHKITEGWRGKLDFYSVMYGGGVHVIDLMQWLTRDRVVEVAAYGNRICSAGTDFRFNDMMMSILRCESGMTAKISANFGCVFPHFHRLALYGTQATYINDLPNAKLYTSRDPAAVPRDITTAYPGTHKGDLLYAFVDAIVHNSVPEVSADDIFECMSVCFAIEKASQRQTTVPVDYI